MTPRLLAVYNVTCASFLEKMARESAKVGEQGARRFPGHTSIVAVVGLSGGVNGREGSGLYCGIADCPYCSDIVFSLDEMCRRRTNRVYRNTMALEISRSGS